VVEAVSRRKTVFQGAEDSLIWMLIFILLVEGWRCWQRVWLGLRSRVVVVLADARFLQERASDDYSVRSNKFALMIVW
jgi:hypothetical protein